MIHYITCKILSRTTTSKIGWQEKQNEINNHAQSTVQIYILHLADSFIQSDLQMRSTQVIHSKETVRTAVKHSTKMYWNVQDKLALRNPKLS